MALTPVIAPIRRREWLVLAAILLLAAGLRLAAPGITEFKRDEANLSQLALDLARGRAFPLLGIGSSVGVPNPPISVYLFAIPYALDDSPVPATLFVGLLNVIAVGLTWALARRYYGPTAAPIAGVLYAVSPWAVIYSRKIWAQDLLPPFVVATVFTGLLGLGEDRRWARWLHWPLLAITVQIHYGAFVLIPLSLLMLVLWGQRRRRVLAAAVVPVLVALLPALIGFYRDDWLSRETIEKALQADAVHDKRFGSEALDYAWFTAAGMNIHSLAGPEQFRRYLDSAPDVFLLFKLIPLAAVLTAVWLVWRVVKQAAATENTDGAEKNKAALQTTPDLVLVVWLALPVLAFTWQWIEVVPHYMIPLMPAVFILVGVGAARLVAVAGRRRSVLAGGAALLAVIAALQIVVVVQLLRFLDQHHTPGGFGTPLHYLLDVRDAVLARRPDDVIVVSAEELAPYDETPAVWGVLLDAVPDVRFVNGARTVVIPQGQALELIAVIPGGPAYRGCTAPDCRERAGDVFPLRSGSNSYFVLREVQPGDWADAILSIEPVQFANGAQLTGYAVQGEGIWLEWRLSGPVAQDYQAFIHALDEQGARLDQRDRPAWPGRYWRDGDRLYLWFDFALPPGTATLFVGMYTTDGANFTNVRVLNPPPGDDLAALGAFVELER